MARDEYLPKVWLASWGVALAFGIAGCDHDGANARHAPDASHGTETPQGHQPSVVPAMAPRFPELELFVNNRKSGGTNGCTSSFPLVPGPQHPSAESLAVEHAMRCGHPGAVSKITWSYTGTDARGDHLRLERTFPHEEPNAETTTIEIVFTGDEVTVFEDDFQRVILRAPTQARANRP